MQHHKTGVGGLSLNGSSNTSKICRIYKGVISSLKSVQAYRLVLRVRKKSWVVTLERLGIAFLKINFLSPLGSTVFLWNCRGTIGIGSILWLLMSLWFSSRASATTILANTQSPWLSMYLILDWFSDCCDDFFLKISSTSLKNTDVSNIIWIWYH